MSVAPLADRSAATRRGVAEVRVAATADWSQELIDRLRGRGVTVERCETPFEPPEGARAPIVVADAGCEEIDLLGVTNALRRAVAHGFDPGEVIFVGPDWDTVGAEAARGAGAFDWLRDPPDVNTLVAAVRGLTSTRRRTTRLRDRLREARRELGKRTTALESSRVELVNCLTRASVYRDGETGLHLGRVGRFAEVIAEELGCDRDFVATIGMAAPLHDIGKIGIPDAILLKPGRFTEDERREMQKHAEIGGEIVRSIADEIIEHVPSPTMAMASRIALTHHEWYDGGGYPKGLAGEAIPLEGRITAIADVFDALTSDRPYKEAYDLVRALKIMREGRGTQFDPEVFDAFVAGLDRIVELRYGGGMSASEVSDGSSLEETRWS